MRLPTLPLGSLLTTLAAAPLASAQSPRNPNWAEIERDTFEHTVDGMGPGDRRERRARLTSPGRSYPRLGTGATDMSFTRAKGIQCFGFGPAIDMGDGPRGFGAHSDQERILESELHRFVRLKWEIVTSLARTSSAPVP